jgi:succinate dehydrogenase flavin-adding protein (antitoxin of CptAB toxin-antitoxin module)
MSLAKRAKLRDKKAVSIFIDEAYRVINKNSDLATDILREAKAEIIIAIQNESQLINKLGEFRYKELKGNLTEQFIFRCNDKNHSLETDIDVSKIATHEFVKGDSKEILQSAKIFIDEAEANRAELKYQLRNGVLEKILDPKEYESVCQSSDEHLAIFDETLYERDNSFLLLNLVCGEMSIKEIYDRALEEKIVSEIEKIAIERMIFGASGGEEEKKPFKYFFKR